MGRRVIVLGLMGVQPLLLVNFLINHSIRGNISSFVTFQFSRFRISVYSNALVHLLKYIILMQCAIFLKTYFLICYLLIQVRIQTLFTHTLTGSINQKIIMYFFFNSKSLKYVLFLYCSPSTIDYPWILILSKLKIYLHDVIIQLQRTTIAHAPSDKATSSILICATIARWQMSQRAALIHYSHERTRHRKRTANKGLNYYCCVWREADYNFRTLIT